MNAAIYPYKPSNLPDNTVTFGSTPLQKVPEQTDLIPSWIALLISTASTPPVNYKLYLAPAVASMTIALTFFVIIFPKHFP